MKTSEEIIVEITFDARERIKSYDGWKELSKEEQALMRHKWAAIILRQEGYLQDKELEKDI